METAREIFDVRLRLLAKRMEPGVPAAPDPRAYHQLAGILAGTITADHYRSLSGEALSDSEGKNR